MQRGGAYNEDWAKATDATDALLAQLGDFCGTVAQLSKDNAPPAVNAANGWFREAMWSGKELVPLQTPYGNALQIPDGQQLYNLLVSFGQGLKQSFEPENYSATGFTNITLFKASLEQLGTEVGAVVKDVVGLFSGNADWIKIEADVKALIDKTKNLGVKLNGAHANGWIAVKVRESATTTGQQAQALQTSLADPDSKKFAGVVKGICDKLVAIPQFENKPWLYGEWQIEFQAIMDAASQGAKAEVATK